ncbi:NAD(P)-dependent oxidoreductase [Falsiroseomonas tokyonensis]|uniref:NAD(P)-dependent oxidoreductase n=1 Tax=Falsiroseomonas tokyonensis TaxID=430521 RepID=A0ABV7BSY1_9PROT|nr:NAD(P)-dependent oxidoreductase [Falsiroseomonas tokyonensis]MBU8537956.1 NAD(P)-dependent oxidoreductase [Falsiroseomonas tokyonensis]
MRVGVVGLGQMGLGLAGRLVEQGADVCGFDLDAGRRAAAQARGVRVVEAAEVVVAPMVLLSLPQDRAVEAVLLALLPALPKQAVVADTSTLDPQAARRFAAAAADWGVDYLDAPVSGGPAGAAAGTLAMMLGGEAAAIERARPALALVATRLVHVGGAGAGQVAKLVNNLMVATHLAVAGEALRLGALAGVAPEALLPVVNAASGRSAATEVNFPKWILPGGFDSGFTAGLMRKDVRLAQALAADVGAALPVCAAAVARWEASEVADGADFNRVPAAILGGA